MKISTQMKTKWMQFKVSALSASVTALIVSGIPTQISASDIDIYQAGGTGEVNIKFMLDRSLSMGDGSRYGKLQEDYEYTASACHNMNQKVIDLSVPNPNNNQGRKRYNITRDSNNGAYILKSQVYEYVGIGNGQYTLTERSIGGTQLYVKPVTRSICHKRFCDATTSLPTNLFVKGDLALNATKPNILTEVSYIYAEKNDQHCSIFLNNTISSSVNDADKRYVKRIKETCEKKPDTTNEYYCLSRFTNLKKALYSLVLNETIDLTKNFALGVYSSGRDFNPLGFTKMDDQRKK